MEIIINEWLLEYLRPDATKTDRVAAIQFVNALVRRCDKMVIKRKSPFANKLCAYVYSFGWDACSRKRFSDLYKLVFLDSDKTIIADESDLQDLPEDIAAKTPEDDKYLIELWYSNQDRIVLTTDAKLRDKLKDIPSLKICLIQEFLKEYLV
jgi:hypothetical protein